METVTSWLHFTNKYYTVYVKKITIRIADEQTKFALLSLINLLIVIVYLQTVSVFIVNTLGKKEFVCWPRV